MKEYMHTQYDWKVSMEELKKKELKRRVPCTIWDFYVAINNDAC